MNPVLPIFEKILLPGAIEEHHITTPIGNAVVEYHLNSGLPLLVLPQHHQNDFPDTHEIYPFGCRAKVLRCLTIDDNSCTILLEGINRIRTEDIVFDEQVGFLAEPIDIQNETCSDEEYGFWFDKLKKQFAALIQKNGEIHPQILPLLEINTDDERFIHMCSNHLLLNREKKLLFLASTHPIERLKILLTHIEQEMDFQDLNFNAIEEVQKDIEKQNRAYFVRKQIQRLHKEIDTPDLLTENRDLKKLQKTFIDNPPPQTVMDEIHAEIIRLSKMSVDSSEYNIGKNWLTSLSKLPWKSPAPKEIDIDVAQQCLDKDHHGLTKVKERIIEQLAVQKCKKQTLGTILCLVGPPGVGKTSLSKSIAKALERPYARISLAGIKDEAEIRGHRRTYIGSMPGRFIRALQKSKTKAPLIVLDEIDKIGRDVRGDPSSALLEILDPEQNDEFVDHYIDVPFDLSQVFFICTANTLDTVDPALRDRLEILQLHSYTREEKHEITRKHLLEKVATEHGIASIPIQDTLIPFLIDGYTREAGLRKLSQRLASLARKTAVSLLRKEEFSIDSEEQVRALLGPELPPPPPIHDIPIGQTLGLAWTPVGGEVLRIQTILLHEKNGKVRQTGNLGQVMKESIEIAYAYINANHKFKNTHSDIHVHIPQGSISKDGPSAGLAIALAIYSVQKNQRSLGGIAMTGELDLSGHVNAIGGLKEKILAAYRANITTVVIPTENQHELVDIPPSILTEMTIHLIEHIEEALTLCFEK
ncbi:MAG: endopeptidase La [Deltaproteobacteria bacterium]|nr:endopeptidase La [Deltaproteobacteria bacterium]